MKKLLLALLLLPGAAFAQTSVQKNSSGVVSNGPVQFGSGNTLSAVTGATVNFTGATQIGIVAGATPYTGITGVPTVSLLGNPTGGTANASAITLGASLQFVSSALNTIQAITTASSPTFAGLTLSSLTTNHGLVTTNGSGVLSTTLTPTGLTSVNGLALTSTAATLDVASGSSLQTLGGYTEALTFTANTAVTFPTSGTLATTAGTVAPSGSINTNGIGYWVGANSLASTAALASGQILIGSSGVAPVPAAINSTNGGVQVQNGAGSITMALQSAIYGPTSVGVNTGTTPSATALQVVDTGTASPRGITNDQYNTGTNSAQFNARKARGTFATPTTIVTGDILARFLAWGHDGSNFIESGNLRFTSTGTIAATRVPSQAEIWTSTNALPSVLTKAATFGADQSLVVVGPVSASNLTAPNGIAVAGVFTTLGNFNQTLTFTNNTNVTFPTSGTLATTSQLATGANPTGTIATAAGTVVNGSASTFLRSDGAPALPATMTGVNSIASATSTPLTLGTGTSGTALTIASATNNASFGSALSVTGHTTFEGVTSTGATGTGNIVYSASPTLAGSVAGEWTALTLKNSDFNVADQVSLLFQSGGSPTSKISQYLPGSGQTQLRFYTSNTSSILTLAETIDGAQNILGAANISASGILSAAGSAAITGYSNVNNVPFSSTTSLNPGLLVYGGSSANFYGIDLGYNSDFRLRLFAAPGKTIAFAGVSSAGAPASQSDFTEWATISASVANFKATTSASSSTTGSVTIGNGTAATNVGIGGGNVNAGGTITAGGTVNVSGSSGQPFQGDSSGTSAGIRLTNAGGTPGSWLMQADSSKAGLAFYSLTASAYRAWFNGTGDFTVSSATAATSGGAGAITTNGGILAGLNIISLSTTSGTSTTAAAITGKSLGLTENLFAGGTGNFTGDLATGGAAIGTVRLSAIGSTADSTTFAFLARNSSSANLLLVRDDGLVTLSQAAGGLNINSTVAGGNGSGSVNSAGGFYFAKDSFIGSTTDSGAGPVGSLITLGGIYSTKVVTAGGLAETGATFAGTVVLTAGAGTITSAAITTSSVVVLSRKTTSGAGTYPQIDVGSGSATITGTATDGGTYNWRVIQ